MPFSINVTLEGCLADQETIQLLHWLEDAFATGYVLRGTAFAKARNSKGDGKLILNFEGVLMEQVAMPGDQLMSHTIIVKASADGELLPYNRSAALFYLDS